MLRFVTTAGLVLALSQAAFAQAPPAPPASNPTGSHMTSNHMMTKNHMMMKKHTMSKSNSMMSHKSSMMHGSQMNGTTPKGAAPSHSP